MNDALSLWAALRTEHPERVARVADHIEPVHGTTQELVDRMLELRRSASTGDDRCGGCCIAAHRPAMKTWGTKKPHGFRARLPLREMVCSAPASNLVLAALTVNI